MEGFKILETITDNVEYNIWTVLSIILGFTLIVFGIMGVYYIGISYKFSLAISLLSFVIGIGIIVLGRNFTGSYYTTYKVTPIEDRYSIDLNKYEIVSQNGEILTIKEK